MHRRNALLLTFALAVFPLLSVLGGCQTTSPGKTASTSELRPMETLTISVTYRERMLLPPGCTLLVELINISQLNPEDNDVANSLRPVQAAPPFPAVLKYDPTKLIDRVHYSLNATIKYRGQMLFTGSTRMDPRNWPKGKPVEIVVNVYRPKS